MLCKLCSTEHEKLCKAHLIPASFYRFMYPNNKVEGEPLRMVLHNINYTKKSLVGLYDTNILCSSCDNILGQLDEYGKKAMLDCEPRKVFGDGGNEVFVMDDIDVAKLSMFFLSVLWRCSISKRKELSEVHIGDKFENKIRELLLFNSETNDEFPIVITRYRYLNGNYKKMLFLPKPLKMESLNYYYLYFPNGYKVLIKVDSRPQHAQLDALTLKVGKPVHIICYDLFENTDEYERTSVKAKAMGKSSL